MKNNNNRFRSSVFTIFFISSCFFLKLSAQTGQSGPNPIILNTTDTIDKIKTLMACGAALDITLTQAYNFGSGNSYIGNFNNNTTNYFKWTVSNNTASNYLVYALITAQNNIPLRLTVEGTSNVLDFTTNSFGWDRLKAGVITIPSGTSTLKLVRNTLSTAAIGIKSLELIPVSDTAAYFTRINNFKSSTDTFSKMKYGIMTQFGTWGYPQTGTTKKTIEGLASTFDVPKFIEMVKSSGADYVVWSITWAQYRMLAPISSVNVILNDTTTYTSKTDLIQKIAQACHDNGLKFIMYYHEGFAEPAWYNINWPSPLRDTFPVRGTGDKSVFINNWKTVVAEIGNRYATLLDGWMFDDGFAYYYPVPFEAFGKVAKSGNPNRIIAYNSWILGKITEFQDFYFGESEAPPGPTYGSSPIGGNGIFTNGPQKGSLEHYCFRIDDNDWAIHLENQVITPRYSGASLANWTFESNLRHAPLSMNVQMYEDGTMASSSIKAFSDLKSGLRILKNGKNDNDNSISYFGSWSAATNRSAPDVNLDIHYSTINNDSLQIAFYGTGIQYITDKNTDQANFDLYIDHRFVQSINCYDASYSAQQIVFQTDSLSLGAHTLTAIKKGGTYMELDAILPSVMVNDTSTLIKYSGNWNYSANRGIGDFKNDLHYTYKNNNSFAYTFNGTGIEYINGRDINEGNVDIYIDGIFQKTINCYSPSYKAQQINFSNYDLSEGIHTIKGIKRSGLYMQVDAFRIFNK